MFGFVGLGAAGGNVVDEAAKNEFPAIAINFSQRDLDSLEYVKERLCLVGSEGVGKNREKAIELMEKNWESALAFVKENFSTPAIEVIVVTFSTSGGSGSGIAPLLLEIMMNEMDDKTFIAAPILPDLSEAVGNQINCIKTSEELSRLDLCVLPIDNEQTKKNHPSYGKNQLYQATNQGFIYSLMNLLEFTERQSKNGVLDRKDLLAILKTKGVAAIAKAEITKMVNGSVDLSAKGIAQSIQDSWRESIFSPIESGKIVRAGVIFSGPESLIQHIQLGSIFSPYGMPWDVFEGYYEGDNGVIYTIVAGLPWYKTRLGKVEDIVNKNEIQAETEDVYVSKIDFAFRRKEVPMKKKSAMDIISRYKR